MAPYRRALEEQLTARGINRHLTSALSAGGRIEEAREAYAEMMRTIPNLTAAKFRQVMVFSALTLERKVDNPKKVGLPD